MCGIFDESEFDFEEAVAQKEMEQWQINKSRNYTAIDIFPVINIKPGTFIEWCDKVDFRHDIETHAGDVIAVYPNHIVVRCWCSRNTSYNVSLNKVDIFTRQTVIKNYRPTEITRQSFYDFKTMNEKIFG